MLILCSENQLTGNSRLIKEVQVNMEISMNVVPVGAQSLVNRLASNIYNFCATLSKTERLRRYVP